jgi:hypothetical protein
MLPFLIPLFRILRFQAPPFRAPPFPTPPFPTPPFPTPPFLAKLLTIGPLTTGLRMMVRPTRDLVW